MFYKARRKEIKLYDSVIDCISFGKGNKNLVIIPGVGEGFVSFKGLAIPFALMYKKFAKKYKVYVFSRRRVLPKKHNTSDMADDIIKCLNILGADKTSILGVSLGGMIAQQIAIKKTLLLDKLVLVVTIPKHNEIIDENVTNWIKLAKKKDYKGIMMDTCNKTYTKNLLLNRLTTRIISLFKPKSFDRFIIEAEACMSHDCLENISNINCLTLIIAGGKDKILGLDGSLKLNELIKNSEIYIYKNYSHGAYDEARDFKKRVYNYLNKDNISN